MKVEAKLEMSAGGLSAALRLGPIGFQPEKFEAYYGSGHVDFIWRRVRRKIARVAVVSATTVNPVRKSTLLPGRSGHFDHEDRRAIGTALSEHADYAWFGHVRDISGAMTANFHPLARYSDEACEHPEAADPPLADPHAGPAGRDRLGDGHGDE